MPPVEDPDPWADLFNGKDLTGWKTHPDDPGDWKVENNILVGRTSKCSHLFTTRGDYQDFHFFVEMKVNANGNTGQYFRCQFQSARPFGYEAQIETINPEIRPGQLLAAVDKQRDVKGGTRLPASGPGIVYQLAEGNDAAGVERVPADTWFTQEVIVRGNHIVVKFNDKIVVDVVDPNDLFRRGHLAPQVFTADHHRSCPSSEGQRTKTRG